MNQPEEDDLWQLLGKARTPVVSPYFARNVVREARAQQHAPSRTAAFFTSLLRYWQIPAMALCALAIAGGAMLNHPRPASGEDHQLVAMVETVSQSPDFPVIGNLDELLDTEQNSVWLAADSN